MQLKLEKECREATKLHVHNILQNAMNQEKKMSSLKSKVCGFFGKIAGGIA